MLYLAPRMGVATAFLFSLLLSLPLQAKTTSVNNWDTFFSQYLSGQDVSRFSEFLNAEQSDSLPRMRTESAARLSAAYQSFLPQLVRALDENHASVWLLKTQYEHLKADHTLFLSYLADVDAKLNQLGGTSQEGFTEQYLTLVSPLLAGLDSFFKSYEKVGKGSVAENVSAMFSNFFEVQNIQSVSSELATLIDPPYRPIIRASGLPYDSINLASQSPKKEPAIKPSYQQSEPTEPVSGDLSSTLQTPLSDDILLLAEKLDYDPAAVFSHVHSNISREWYAGAMKGAEGTLVQGSGNSVDQASLLIALLRASSVPARYVHGVVEMSIAQLQKEMGIEDPKLIVQAIRASGVPVESIVRGGRIAAVEVEHTWVSAYVPYSNYRGATVDRTGKLWLPLDPSQKDYTYQAPSGVLGDMEEQVAGIIDSYFNEVQSESPLENLKSEVEQFVSQRSQGYEEQLGYKEIAEEELRYLPNSLQTPVVAVTAEEANLSESRQQRVEFRVYGSIDSVENPILERSIPVSQLASKRVTISYIAASSDDHNTINGFGGLDVVPPKLVQLRPQLKVEGKLVSLGKQPVDMAGWQRLEVSIKSPNHVETVSKNILAGGYEAIGISAQRVTQTDSPSPVGDTEYLAARLLSQAALRYLKAWDAAETEIAALAGQAIIRPLPALTFVGQNLSVDRVLGEPQLINWDGVTMDAALRVTEAIPAKTMVLPKDQFFQLSALHGSYLEHKRFEEDFSVTSISADKAIAVARQQGLEVLSLPPGSEGQLSELLHPEAVMEEVSNWLTLGYRVDIPVSPIGYEDWNGSAWVVTSDDTGAQGFFLSGGIAGGQSASVVWPEDLRNALRNDYSAPPETNLSRVAQLVKIAATDYQTGAAGSDGERLMLRAQTADGRPVMGVPVTFKRELGGLEFIDPEQTAPDPAVEELVAITDVNGIASVEYMHGTDTNVSTIYRRTDWAQYYSDKVSLSTVTASYGNKALQTPFHIFTGAGPLADLVINHSGKSHTVGAWADTVRVHAVDQFGNPISNVDVNFVVDAPSRGLNAGSLNAAVAGHADMTGCPAVASIWNCGDGAYAGSTSPLYGAVGYLFNGSESNVEYRWLVSSGSISKPIRIKAVGSDSSARVEFVFRMSASGGIGAAAKIGEVYPEPLHFAIYRLNRIKQFDTPGNPAQYEREPINFVNGARLTVSQGGALSDLGEAYDLRRTGPGQYQMQVRVGGQPGLNTVKVTGAFDQDDDPKTYLAGWVYGIEPTIFDHTPIEGLSVDPGSVTVDTVSLSHAVLPEGFSDPNRNVFIYEDDSIILPTVDEGQGVDPGTGIARLPSGLKIDIDKQYTAKLVINRGSKFEIASDPYPLPVSQQTIVTPEKGSVIRARREIDLMNEWVCDSDTDFEFSISHPATITIDLSNPVTGQTTNLVTDGSFSKGSHDIELPISSLNEGYYQYTMSSVSGLDGHSEEVEGYLEVKYYFEANLPVGHAIEENVDLFDGHLVLSRTDLSIPGQGPDLEFKRFYSSNNRQSSTLGTAWGHNLDSQVRDNGCGAVSISGGVGGGRYFPDGKGGYRPQKGLHGHLERHQEGDGWVFTAKDGTKYYYGKYPFNDLSWQLAVVEDTNGNVLSLGYDPAANDPRLMVARDSAGRTLQFEYELNPGGLSFINDAVISKVKAPYGIELFFEYDDQGRLIKATKLGSDGTSVSEAYQYDAPSPLAVEYQYFNDLNAVITPNGHRTEYTYNLQNILVRAANTFPVPVSAVTEIKRLQPSSQNEVIDFSYGSRESRTGGLTARANRGGGRVKDFTLNQYGSPTAVTGPAGTVLTTWASDDVVMTSRTDERGVTTQFDHDEWGNVIYEKTDGMPAITRSYEDFGLKRIRNRVSEETGLNGETTRYNYDGAGNRIKIEHPNDTKETFTYSANGNLLTHTDRNGHLTAYTKYDAYGYVNSIANEIYCCDKLEWNELGLKVSETNGIGAKTEFQYDGLGRMVKKTDAEQGVSTYTYDDQDNRLSETDPEGRQTFWEYDERNQVTDIRKSLAGGFISKEKQYDRFGNLKAESDWLENKNWTTHEYDAANRQTAVIRADGEGNVRRTDITYDGAGNVTRKDFGLGRHESYSYDNLNRLTSVTNALGDEARRIERDDRAKTRTETDALGRKEVTYFDELGRPIRTEMPLGAKILSTFDGNGNLIEEINPVGRVTEHKYDQLNRKLEEVVYEPGGRALSRTYFSYDKAGNLTRKVNGRGVAEVMDYDKLNRLIRREFPASSGEAYSYQYDGVGNRIQEAWPNGNLITQVFDELNRLDLKSDLIGVIEDNTHDNNGNLIKRIDGNGNLFTYQYNALKELREKHLPEGRKEVLTYDLVGNVLTESREREDGSRASETEYSYDLLNRKEAETDPNGFTASYNYDKVGNLISVVDKRNNTSTHTYNALDQRVTTTDPNGDVLTVTYDLVDNPVKEVDKKGHVTNREYDALNRVTQVKRNNLTVVEKEYDEVGNLVNEIDAKGNLTVRVYDSANRLVELSREESSLTRYAYDLMGNRTSECDPESRATNWRYDHRGRQIFAINNLGQVSTYNYDGNGNRIAETKPKGNALESAHCGYNETVAASYPGDSADYTWSYGFDGADRLASVTDGDGEQTRYTYNYLDLRTSHTDALSQTTAMAYDNVGNRVSLTYPDGAQEQYTVYDGNGNLKAMTDAKGNAIAYDYDLLNRETLRSFTPIEPLIQEVLQVTTAYDKNGNVVTISETDTQGETRTTSQSYDSFDRMIRRKDSFGKVTNYAYDDNGNRTQLVDPDQNVTRYSFDKLNRVSTVTNLQGTTEYSYDKSGLLLKVAYPGNALMVYQYDDVGRTEAITHTQNSAKVSEYRYEYDAHGNRTRQEEENGRGPEVTTYAYDNLDRLTEVNYPDVPVGTGTTVLYNYDVAYNRTGETTLNVEATTIADKTYHYNSRNQLTSVDDNLEPAQNVSYTFDANGNQTAKTKAAVDTDFVYDVRDNLRSVTTGGSTVGQFLYDYRGMRIEKDGARGIERYSYDDQRVLTQFDETGATLAKFEYGGQRLISLNSLENGLQYYHFDALGSPVTLTKPDGSVQARYSYDAWGRKRYQSGTSWNRFGFTGHEHDEETNLVYAKARYYDPDTGRFLSQDPWEGDSTIAPSLNKYLYAYQNPVVYWDPDGREAYPLFNVPVNEKTDLVTPFTRVNTGNVVADHVLAFAASVPNFGYMAVNGLSNGMSLPLQGYAAARGKSLDEADAEITAHLASTGPLGPILLTGSAPFRAPATLSRIRRNLNGVEETESVRHAELVEESASGLGSTLPSETYRDKNGRLRNSVNNQFVRDPESAAARGELTPTQTLRRDQQAQFNVNRKEVLQEEQLCPYCQTNSQEAVDHIVSVEQGQKIVEGGVASREEILEFLPSIDNLTGACTTCNSGAGGKVKTSGEAVGARQWQMVNPTPEIVGRVDDLNKRFDLE